MTRIAYVNGRYVDHRHATISMDDRAHHFSDGVYEYLSFYNRKLVYPKRHLDRLERSVENLRIPMPMSKRALLLVMNQLIAHNTFENGGLYMQVSRGVARRDHAFPKVPVKPGLSICLSPSKMPTASEYQHGVRVISTPDQRWARRDIKTVSLLGNILAKQKAVEAGAREAWLVQSDGVVTEGSASNAYIVDTNGVVITHPLDAAILGGVTREFTLELMAKAGIKVEERTFTLQEALAASEAFMTSTSIKVLPVTRIDDTVIGNGKPGPVAQKLLALFADFLHHECGKEVLPR